MSGGKPLVASAARGAAVSAADVGRVGEVRGCARTSAGGTRGTSIGGTAACAERRRASGEGGGGGGGCGTWDYSPPLLTAVPHSRASVLSAAGGGDSRAENQRSWGKNGRGGAPRVQGTGGSRWRSGTTRGVRYQGDWSVCVWRGRTPRRVRRPGRARKRRRRSRGARGIAGRPAAWEGRVSAHSSKTLSRPTLQSGRFSGEHKGVCRSFGLFGAGLGFGQ